MKPRSDTKRLRSIVLVGLMALLAGFAVVASGCSSSQQSSTAQSAASLSSAQSSSSTLRVAVQYNALSLPTIYAEDAGLFQDEGLDVELFTFVNGAEENKAIEKGEVDLASNGLASVYLLASGDYSWIGESDTGSATVAVYAREDSAPAAVSGQLADHPDVRGSADTLRGLSVLGPAGTMEEWATVSYFSQFGLEEGVDYQFIEMDRIQAANSVIDGTADVFVATDVDYCRLMEEAGFVPLASGIEATGVPFNNGYLVSNGFMETRRDDAVAFLRAVYRAAEILNGDEELACSFALDYYKMNGKPATLEDVQRETQVRKFLVPSDFTASGYKLGSGVLDVGEFNVDLGALSDAQIAAIQSSIDPQLLDAAFGITVEAATLS